MKIFRKKEFYSKLKIIKIIQKKIIIRKCEDSLGKINNNFSRFKT